ncbi:hypothetical protein SAMN05444162_4895 [Paenibacillaceae bacterium GAS479]|nr:hypothetical protein SAMN05444162_4895 [Paenibacillaceae bacterium GAS479]
MYLNGSLSNKESWKAVCEYFSSIDDILAAEKLQKTAFYAYCNYENSFQEAGCSYAPASFYTDDGKGRAVLEDRFKMGHCISQHWNADV